MENEIWKPVKGWEDLYEVSTLGRFRSKKRIYVGGTRWGKTCLKTRPPRIMKPSTLVHSRHKMIGFSKNGKTVHFCVQRIVLETFIGPCPPGKEACHFPDRNPANNRLNNLMWGTRLENQ